MINNRDHYDYYRPSQSLFCDHCDSVAKRYDLMNGLVHKETLEDLDYDAIKGVSINDEKLFTVTSNKSIYYARIVILATGPASKPQIPMCPSMQGCRLSQACHSMDITKIPEDIIKSRISAKRPTNILVVGGGLTSAQIADLAIRQGVTKVWHIMRGPVKLKHFDVSLEWMGKYKNTEHARFWLADSDEERLNIINEARQGGSMTYVFYKILQKHIAAGTLDLRTHTNLVDAKFEGPEGNGYWKITTEPPIEDMPPIDYIYFATGMKTDLMTLPYLQTLLQKYPIQDCGGLPCLTEDLTWSDDVPLFMAGKLSSLQIGPAAPNIGGAKLCAERIAWAIEDMAKTQKWNVEGEEFDSPQQELRFGYSSGHGNRFEVLQECA